MKLLKTLDKGINAAVLFLGIADMALLFLVLLANVLIRVLGASLSLSWYSEVVEILFAWLVMLGAVALCRNADHFRVDLLLQKFGKKRRFYWLEAFCYLTALVFYAYFLYFGYSLTVNASQTMPVLQIPKGAAYLCMPVSALLMCAYSIRDIAVAVGRATGKMPLPKQKEG